VVKDYDIDHELSLPSRPILLDVSRSIWRASTGRRPTGVDRVCLSYITHYRTHAQAVVQYQGFRRILSPETSSALFDLILDDGPNFKARLIRRVARNLPDVARRYSGNGRPYLNVGHTGLNDPAFRKWISRSHVAPIYMVHDLIPITHPEYARPGEAERHEQRMKTVLKTAAGVIGNSDATLASLKIWKSAHQFPSPPTKMIWLGTMHFQAKIAQPPAKQPYFLTLGTIEGRKNHLLLLNLWRDWAERGENPIPKLVIVGQRGWAAEQTLSMLDCCPSLKPHVVELSNCDDATLADLIGNARALLFPSFVEGYGMPLAEALAAGVPVIASDLPVFREIAGSIPTYCDPLDGRSWRDAILAYTSTDNELRASQCEALSHYKAPTWVDHFKQLDLWLAELKLI
jgi:glycosyltransferase involved in cell wall biosynthesis